jgi:hypothetical protein
MKTAVRASRGRDEDGYHDRRPDQCSDGDGHLESADVERILLMSQVFSHRQVQHDDRAVQTRPDESTHCQQLQQRVAGDRRDQRDTENDDQHGRGGSGCGCAG